MSPCHTALHLCIFLSLAGTLPCPSAVTLSLYVYICFWFLQFQPRVSLWAPSSCPSFCLSNQILLTQKLSFSTLHPLEQSSKCLQLSLFCLCLSIFLPMPQYFFCQSSFSLSWTLEVGSLFIMLHSLSPSVYSSILSPLFTSHLPQRCHLYWAFLVCSEGRNWSLTEDKDGAWSPLSFPFSHSFSPPSHTLVP